MSVLEESVLASWRARWDATPLFAKEVGGGLHQPPIGKSSAAEPGATRPAHPYATFEAKAGGTRPNEYSSNGAFIAYVDVILKLYGIGKEATGQVMRKIENVFDDFVLSLEIAGAAFMRCEATKPANLEREPEAVTGEDIWRAQKTWIVWLHQSP